MGAAHHPYSLSGHAVLGGWPLAGSCGHVTQAWPRNVLQLLEWQWAWASVSSEGDQGVLPEFSGTWLSLWELLSWWIQTEGTSGRWAHFLEALLEKQSQSTSAELLGPAMNLKATNTPLLFFHLSSFFPVMHTYKQPFLALDGLSLVTHLQ